MNLSKAFDDFQKRKAMTRGKFIKAKGDKPTVRELLDKYFGHKTIGESRNVKKRRI